MHVSVRSDQEGVAVLDRIRIWLSVLAALSANSPLRNGEDTGYASHRTQAWGRWPTAGPSGLFGLPASGAALAAVLTETDEPQGPYNRLFSLNAGASSAYYVSSRPLVGFEVSCQAFQSPG